MAAHAQSAVPTFRSAAAATLGGDVVSFRGASSAATTGAGALVIVRPSATRPNDLMIAAIGIRPAQATLAPPAGWVPIRRVDNTFGVTHSLAVYGKVAGAAEPDSYSWTLGESTHAAGGIQSFSGVDTANPVDIDGVRTTGSALAHPTLDVTTTAANAMVVTAHTFPSAATWTPPAGMTEGFDTASPAPPNSSGQSIVASWVPQAAAGATGAKTATASNDADGGITHILVLRPSASLSIGRPPGSVADDVLIAAIGVRPSTATLTPPAGWSLVRRIDNANAAANSLAIYSRVATAAEPSSYEWGVNGASFAVGGIQAFANVDTQNPIDVESGELVCTIAFDAGGTATPTVTAGTLIALEEYPDKVYRVLLATTAMTGAKVLRIWPAGTTVSATGNTYVGGVQAEDATYPGSYLRTTTATVTRAADRLEFPFPHAPEAMTVYAEFIEQGQPDWATVGGTAPRIVHIGASSNGLPRIILYKLAGGDNYQFFHDPATSVSSAVDINPVYGNRIELRGILNADGSVQIGASKNGGSESLGGASAANALAAAWSSPTVISLGCVGATGQGDILLRSVKVARGIQTLGEMRVAG